MQSATGHGLTVHTPLMVSEERVTERMQGIAVDGRPADCVKLAIANLWPDRFGRGTRPDLVISGLNSGAAVIASTLFIPAPSPPRLEAAFPGGIPAIAVSLRHEPGQAELPPRGPPR